MNLDVSQRILGGQYGRDRVQDRGVAGYRPDRRMSIYRSGARPVTAENLETINDLRV
jgi:hypothetical protein